MKRIFAIYEHTRVGFPHVILKWHEMNGKQVSPYMVINGVIKPWSWELGLDETNCIERELRRFDEYVGQVYSNNIAVQG